MEYEQMQIPICPEGGPACDDCKDCIYGEEYHLVDGECRRRKLSPTERKFEPPTEVSR